LLDKKILSILTDHREIDIGLQDDANQANAPRLQKFMQTLEMETLA